MGFYIKKLLFEANLPALLEKRKDVRIIKIFFDRASKNKAHGREILRDGLRDFYKKN
jgi:hypothetical protein